MTTSTSKRNKQHKQEALEALEYLKATLHKGDTVYTVLRHVSRSGMTRGIDVYRIGQVSNGGKWEPIWITPHVGWAIDSPQPRDYWEKSMGLKVGGAGMDMGFHVVHSLSRVLFGEDYALKHEWI